MLQEDGETKQPNIVLTTPYRNNYGFCMKTPLLGYEYQKEQVDILLEGSSSTEMKCKLDVID